MTDDKKARNLAETYLEKRMVQTTPASVWLVNILRLSSRLR